MNSGSASAPPIKASKFILAFSFLKFTSKINHLQTSHPVNHQNFKLQILPTFDYFYIFLTVNYAKITPYLV